MKRVLILMSSTSYRAREFVSAAGRLKVNVVTGSDHRQALSHLLPGRSLFLDLNNPQLALKKIQQSAIENPIDGIVAADDETVVLAAMASEALGLPGNPVPSVKATRNKYLMRKMLHDSGLLSPVFRLFHKGIHPKQIASEINYPSVIKPIFLSGSRGVIRVNSVGEFLSAFKEVRKILSEKTVVSRGAEESNYLLAEDYIPGSEVAVEGMLINGRFKLLTIFDKPDPLEGPYFTETIYVTPSRLPGEQQDEIVETTRAACHALGLISGPVHAELRLNEKGAWMIEIAARSIGGLCSRALRFHDNISLEDLILRHSLGMDISRIEREETAAGVMMIPVPTHGILREVSGVNDSKNVPGVEDVVITIAPEQEIAPLPSGNRYLGFIFVRGDSPVFVEKSIREAFLKLKVRIA